jgi:hypothetical protein
MIPTYLQGKSATQIMNKVKDRCFVRSKTDIGYTRCLEQLLLIAVKDALCNAEDRFTETVVRGVRAEARAIAFLNKVLPQKE